MAPSNISQSPSSSLLSWPSTDLSHDIERENPIPDCSSRKGSLRTGSSSGVAAAGCCAIKKARKRRSRALPKPAIKELVADKLNFREMVHELTGKRAPSLPTNSFPSLSNSTASAEAALLVCTLAQCLRAVDTISALLLQSGSSQDARMIRDAIEKASLVQAERRENGPMYDSPADSVLNSIPANVISLELESSNCNGISKVGLLSCLLLK